MRYLVVILLSLVFVMTSLAASSPSKLGKLVYTTAPYTEKLHKTTYNCQTEVFTNGFIDVCVKAPVKSPAGSA